ncbi:MAG: VOC family protein [bacterium]|nr:glyoxalase [Gammaproteobacteria bacterium]HIL97692.1 glyoxalase [Pseudomonadales bacterium]
MKFTIYAQRVFSFKFAESVEFYKDTIGLPVKFEGMDMGWVEFDLGGASLAIERQDPESEESQSYVGRYVGISIQVKDIDVVYKELLERGVEFLGPPAKQPWGGLLAHFKDPDENVITLLGSG